MTAVTRLGDLCSGHGVCSPRPSTSGSPDVFANSKPVHRQHDLWGQHCLHTSELSGGSSTVFVNSRPLGRVGDTIACGSTVANGSPNVFSG